MLKDSPPPSSCFAYWRGRRGAGGVGSYQAGGAGGNGHFSIFPTFGRSRAMEKKGKVGGGKEWKKTAKGSVEAGSGWQHKGWDIKGLALSPGTVQLAVPAPVRTRGEFAAPLLCFHWQGRGTC